TWCLDLPKCTSDQMAFRLKEAHPHHEAEGGACVSAPLEALQFQRAKSPIQLPVEDTHAPTHRDRKPQREKSAHPIPAAKVVPRHRAPQKKRLKYPRKIKWKIQP